MQKEFSEKRNLKLISNFIYHLGLADCWYERREIRYPIIRKLFSMLANIFCISFYLNDLAANFRTDLLYKEKNDVLIINIAYTAIILKAAMLYVKRREIRVFFMNLLENVQDDKGNAAIMVHVPVVLAIVASSVQCLVSFKDHYVEEINIRVTVLFFPKPFDRGVIVNVMVYLALCHFWYMISIMISINYICLCTLVSVKNKFTRAKVFFENLSGTPKNSVQYEAEFLAGVEMYKHALWIARNVQSTIGSLFSIQILESNIMLVFCLLRGVNIPSDAMYILVCFGSYCYTVILIGLYMTYSANITFEAQQISTAIYHSGWENYHDRPALRKLIVVTLQHCQKPIYLTAFGVFNFSYENFIATLRLSYSFFVVMKDFKN